MQWVLIVVMLTADGPKTERIQMGDSAQCHELAGRMSIPENQEARCVIEYEI